MPIEDSAHVQLSGPDVPHVAVVTSISPEGGMEAVALPPGSMWFIVPDPKREDRKIKLVLTRVTLNALHFKCGCAKPACTRTFIFKMHPMGHHPQER